ncbi:uncharacterized protein LOC124172580 [Ischnura elegans]|uniref:uncharacterized protein LOC124172580 n=1 Tax=Ischnura elegans TaxID=197161 RepID=UPI001ED88A85|nr:uncharacterized protein LOC124172580 [Ischnura elegans]
MWIIVFFPEESSVEVVPMSWYCNGKCKWPTTRFTEKIRQMVDKNVSPEDDWHEFTARQMGKNTYSSLKEAREKLIRAEETSDLNTDPEKGKGNACLLPRGQLTVIQMTVMRAEIWHHFQWHLKLRRWIPPLPP